MVRYEAANPPAPGFGGLIGRRPSSQEPIPPRLMAFQRASNLPLRPPRGGTHKEPRKRGKDLPRILLPLGRLANRGQRATSLCWDLVLCRDPLTTCGGGTYVRYRQGATFPCPSKWPSVRPDLFRISGFGFRASRIPSGMRAIPLQPQKVHPAEVVAGDDCDAIGRDGAGCHRPVARKCADDLAGGEVPDLEGLVIRT